MAEQHFIQRLLLYYPRNLNFWLPSVSPPETQAERAHRKQTQCGGFGSRASLAGKHRLVRNCIVSVAFKDGLDAEEHATVVLLAHAELSPTKMLLAAQNKFQA